jgi:endonuclease YncB( thermonuclease family)
MRREDLDAYVAGKSVSCTPISLDQYGRTVATCSVNGTDLGQWLVSNGLALDWREAEHAGRGIWSGGYVAAWLYRVCIRSSGRPAYCSDDANAHP